MNMDELAALDLHNSRISTDNLSQKNPNKKLFLALSYMTTVPLFIVLLLLFSLYVKYESNGYIARQEHRPKFQAIASASFTTDVTVQKQDGRVEALEEFFKKYDSPLVGHARVIIEQADIHKIDYRLLPAIAMQESTLCKKIIKGSFNCWGFGIHGGKVKRFDNYDHAIKVITSTLSKKYIQKGFVDPEEIVKKYTPSDTGRWSDVVSLIMSRLKESI